MTEQRNGAYADVEGFLREDPEAQALAESERERLRGFALALLAEPTEGADQIRQAAGVLGRLVAAARLSEERADWLWLALAACAPASPWSSRCAAEAGIA